MNEQIKLIKQTLKNKKMTYQDFANISGIPISTITKVLSETTKNPGVETINIMFSTLELNQYEKKPQGTVLTEKEMNIVDAVTQCNEHQQDMILSFIAGLQDNQNLGSVVVKRNNNRNANDKKSDKLG